METITGNQNPEEKKKKELWSPVQTDICTTLAPMAQRTLQKMGERL